MKARSRQAFADHGGRGAGGLGGPDSSASSVAEGSLADAVGARLPLSNWRSEPVAGWILPDSARPVSVLGAGHRVGAGSFVLGGAFCEQNEVSSKRPRDSEMVRPLHPVDLMQTKWQVKLPTGPIADACEEEVLEAFRLGCVTPETLMRRGPQASWISFQETALFAQPADIRPAMGIDPSFALSVDHSPLHPSVQSWRSPANPPKALPRSEPPLVGIFAGVSLVLLALLWVASRLEAPQVESSDLHAIVVSRAR